MGELAHCHFVLLPLGDVCGLVTQFRPMLLQHVVTGDRGCTLIQVPIPASASALAPATVAVRLLPRLAERLALELPRLVGAQAVSPLCVPARPRFRLAH